MKFLFISFCLLLCANLGQTGKYYIKPLTFNLKKDYEQFLTKFEDYKKHEPHYFHNYHNETFLHERFHEFERVKHAIKEHNENYKLGLVEFSRKLQPYSDWKPEVKKVRLCGARQPRRLRALSNVAMLRMIKSWPKLPPNTEANFCQFPNPVRDQETCGCCWAVTSVSVLESILFIKKGMSRDFSVQQLVDCDSANDACDGGWPTDAFNYMKLNGLTSGTKYKYKNTKQAGCRKAKYKNVLQRQFVVKTIEVEFKGDEESFKKLLYRLKTPVVVVGHANEEFMSAYNGHYRNDTCPKNDPNHAMVICGFGNDENGDYFLLRNTWSSNWGENGYMKIAANNTCGITSSAMFPVIQGVKDMDPFLGEVFEKPVAHVDRRRRD